MKNKTIKIAILTLIFIVGVLGFGESTMAQTQLGKIDFEGNLTDSLGFMEPAHTEDIKGYVPGRTGGYAVEMDHSEGANPSSPDNYALTYATYSNNPTDIWPESNTLYFSWWVKYNEDFTNTTDNEKWLWTWDNPQEAHQELIFGSQTSTTISGRWQIGNSGNSSTPGWNAGNNVVLYWSAPYVMGNWVHIEVYIQLSTGINHLNADGNCWLKINGDKVNLHAGTYSSTNPTNVITGIPDGYISIPAINATGTHPPIPAGHGTLFYDDYEVWDGLPNAGVYESNRKVFPNPWRINMRQRFVTFGNINLEDKIEIFDISGKIIHNSGNITSDTYKWNVGNISSGIYFYKITGSNKAKGKIVIIR
ncbi:hypothetical protein DRP43_01690 [candidate division TA06 bacterium]|uniref:Secretion system C-terminal sorting domain-containing protein n=1 Tax=candidate division TA06 bacterium TaxID=2250710 RepID=A0A660SNK8_UNCT6|nr:MAG: hypothetical protein DRP43_01690 [candidate division TA06 bacterium]